MDRNDWLLLQALYEDKSMSKVADRFFMSQPAVSYRLQKMEAEFQTTLFTRDSKGVRFTEAGMRLYGYANKMLCFNDEISSVVRQDDSSIGGLITVGATTLFMTYQLVDQLQDFYRLHHNIRINVELHPSFTLRNMFNNGELLFAVIRGNRAAGNDTPCYSVFRERLVIVAPEPITEEYLQTHPFIHECSLSRSPIDTIATEWLSHHFATQPASCPVLISGDSRTKVTLVKAGFGWTLITESRLTAEDGLYSQPVFREDGTPYLFETNLYYSKEIENFTPYRIYFEHFKDYFARMRTAMFPY